MSASAEGSDSTCRPALFDPKEVVTTDKLETDVLSGKAMLNDYIRLRKIGGGQHGEVYMCFKYNPRLPKGDPQRRFQVAMKAVRRDNPRAEQLRRLRQQRLPSSGGITMGDRLNTTEAKIRKEIAIMKKLRHPHVVRLYEVIDDRQRDKIYMIMEYLGGGEVKWRNEQGLPVLTVAQSRRIIRDAVLGLEYLHHQGIIHRDIKPANLLWTTDRQRVKIADFGVSHFSYAQRLAAAGKNGEVLNDPEDPILLEDSDLTRRAGTPSFLAPEIVYEHTNDTSSSPILGSSSGTVDHHQILARRPPITKSIDVWALGVTLYCLLFGKTPFTADPAAHGTEWSLYNAICNSDWTVDDTMGSDRIPTGGRHPRSKDTSEGANVVRLLDHFLQKDMKHRITLEEVKRNSWILKDLPEPQRWLMITDAGRIHVSVKEATDAMDTFEEDSNGAVRSDPHLQLLRRNKGSAAPPTLTRPDEYSATFSPGHAGQDKGKRKADSPFVRRHGSKKLPVKAIDNLRGTQIRLPMSNWALHSPVQHQLTKADRGYSLLGFAVAQYRLRLPLPQTLSRFPTRNRRKSIA
ncbi:kinase-like domain-containing protein [Cyathus striatus]|nr:kinase-like domain-containing protein [Cyathus striatus]